MNTLGVRQGDMRDEREALQRMTEWQWSDANADADEIQSWQSIMMTVRQTQLERQSLLSQTQRAHAVF